MKTFCWSRKSSVVVLSCVSLGLVWNAQAEELTLNSGEKPAAAEQTGSESLVSSSSAGNIGQLAAISPMTSEEKASAIPMPLLEAFGSPLPASNINQNQPQSTSNTEKPAAQAQGDIEPAYGANSTVWYNSPPPSTNFQPKNSLLWPKRPIGKLFFKANGGNYVCSASSVTSKGPWGNGNRQTVITAGHCCSDGNGTWYSDWIFEPGHKNGIARLGSWPAGSATVFSSWHLNRDFSRDLCVLQIHPIHINGSVKDINTLAGPLSWAYGQPLPNNYVAAGWPAEPPYDGGELTLSYTSDAETDTAQAGAFPFTHGVGSNQTGGSSGGPWILKYSDRRAGDVNYFNGLNSYHYVSGRPLEMFGPYIDEAVIMGLFQAVARAPKLGPK